MRLTLTAAAIAMAAIPALAQAQGDTLSHTLDNVVVTGTRNQTDIRHLPMTVSVVGRDKLTEHQRTSILPTLTEQVPGLFIFSRAMMGYGVSDGSAGGMSLRGMGSGSGRMMVLIDGHPQYQGIFGHSIADAYQTLMAERVEVLRGPASMLYGSNAMGGVVNIVTRKMTEDGLKTDLSVGAGSYGTVQTELTTRMRKGKLFGIVAAQYGRSDNNRPRMGFEQYGGYAKLGYDISRNWTAYADIDLTHFNASYPGEVENPVFGARQWITRGVATAVLENRYRNTSGALSVYHNFGRHKINDGYTIGKEPPTDYFRSDDALTGVSWYQSATLFDGNRITLGLDYQHIYGKAWNRDMASGETTSEIGNENENEIAGYIDFRQDLFSWLTIDAGVRLDHHSQTGTEWIPQGGLVVRPVRNGELKAMVSKGFRNPNIREMYFWRPANNALKPERMMNYELSWRQRLAEGAFSYGINVFYLKADNLIQNLLVNGRPLNVNTGELENSGVEAEWSWKINSHWSLNNNYSYLHMTRPVEYTPEFKGFLGADYTAGRWTAGAGLQYVAGLYTRVTPEEKQENFWLLNATVGYRAAKGLHLWVKGENLLAQKYETRYGYPMPRATFMGGVNVSF